MPRPSRGERTQIQVRLHPEFLAAFDRARGKKTRQVAIEEAMSAWSALNMGTTAKGNDLPDVPDPFEAPRDSVPSSAASHDDPFVSAVLAEYGLTEDDLLEDDDDGDAGAGGATPDVDPAPLDS